MASSIEVDRLSKCYRPTKKFGSLSGLQRALAIIGIGDDSAGSKKALSREIWAVKEASFTVASGEVLGIIGRNGAGKTTLLKLLAQITMPTEGRAAIRGRVVSLLELGAGFHPELTGRENIFLNAAFYGIPREEVERNIDDIVAFAELEEFIDAPVKQYSSGMYIRLAFSNAIHMRPDILLADEVLAVGDIGFQNRCMEKMREISDSGITVLFVSHDMEAIKRMCDRCIRLEKGEIVDEGLPGDVVERYQQSVLLEQHDSGRENKLSARNTGGYEQTMGMGEFARLNSVILTDVKGNEKGVAVATQPICVRVRVQTLLEGVTLVIGIDVKCGTVIVFRATTPDRVVAAHAGIHETTLTIPPHLLAERDYSVNVGVRVYHDDDEERMLKQEALEFKVYGDTESDLARSSAGGRQLGVVAPVVGWSNRIMPAEGIERIT